MYVKAQKYQYLSSLKVESEYHKINVTVKQGLMLLSEQLGSHWVTMFEILF